MAEKDQGYPTSCCMPQPCSLNHGECGLQGERELHGEREHGELPAVLTEWPSALSFNI